MVQEQVFTTLAVILTNLSAMLPTDDKSTIAKMAGVAGQLLRSTISVQKASAPTVILSFVYPRVV